MSRKYIKISRTGERYEIGEKWSFSRGEVVRVDGQVYHVMATYRKVSTTSQHEPLTFDTVYVLV